MRALAATICRAMRRPARMNGAKGLAVCWPSRSDTRRTKSSRLISRSSAARTRERPYDPIPDRLLSRSRSRAAARDQRRPQRGVAGGQARRRHVLDPRRRRVGRGPRPALGRRGPRRREDVRGAPASGCRRSSRSAPTGPGGPSGRGRCPSMQETTAARHPRAVSGSRLRRRLACGLRFHRRGKQEMADKVVLHVGLMKSGTTFIQRQLFAHQVDAARARARSSPAQKWADQVKAVKDLIRPGNDHDGAVGRPGRPGPRVAGHRRGVDGVPRPGAPEGHRAAGRVGGARRRSR